MTVLALVLTVLILLIALLMIPFNLSAQIVRREGQSSMEFAVNGIFGFSRITEDGETTSTLLLFSTPQKRREEKQEGKGRGKKREKDEKKKGIAPAVLLGVLPHLPDLTGAVVRLLNGARMSVVLEQLRGEVRVGLGDPGPTGMLLGLTHALGGMVAPWADVLDVNLLPVFNEAVLEGEVEMKLRLRLFRLVGPATSLVLKDPIRRLMMAGVWGA